MSQLSWIQKLRLPPTKIAISNEWIRLGAINFCYLLPVYFWVQTAGIAQAGVMQPSKIEGETKQVAQRVENYQYLVYVNGDSSLLLEQVRKVEPQAFVRFLDERNVIQAGLFNERKDAKKRVESLKSIGVRANVTQIEVVSAIPEYQAEYPDDLYIVYVKSDSALLLDEVHKVEPQAIIKTYQGERVIQAGLFNQRENARQSVIALNSIGITAELKKYDPTIRTFIKPSYRGPRGTYYKPGVRSSDSKEYYVVIPARAKYLPDIAETVELLGAPVYGIEERERPLGNHVAVGPFSDRGTAERWNRYLLDFGLSNSRVYYGR